MLRAENAGSPDSRLSGAKFYFGDNLLRNQEGFAVTEAQPTGSDGRTILPQMSDGQPFYEGQTLMVNGTMDVRTTVQHTRCIT